MRGVNHLAGDARSRSCSSPPAFDEEVVAGLRENIRSIEGGRGWRRDRRAFSSGCPALDRLLPEAGIVRGSLIEWLSDGAGSGAATLAMMVAREAASRGGVLVVMDSQKRFYPPAAAALGIDLERTIVVRTPRVQDEMWALDQVLRCPGVTVAYAAVDKLDWRWFRRLQLAAENGGSLGLLLRPAWVHGQPSWSHVQLLVQPRPSQGPRRWCLEVTHCQGRTPEGTVELELDEADGVVRAKATEITNDE